MAVAAKRRAPARKAAKKRAPAKKAVKGAPAKKAEKRAPARKAVKRSPAKKAAKRAPARKATKKRAPAKKAVKRAPARKATKKRAAAKKAVSGPQPARPSRSVQPAKKAAKRAPLARPSRSGRRSQEGSASCARPQGGQAPLGTAFQTEHVRPGAYGPPVPRPGGRSGTLVELGDVGGPVDVVREGRLAQDSYGEAETGGFRPMCPEGPGTIGEVKGARGGKAQHIGAVVTAVGDEGDAFEARERSQPASPWQVAVGHRHPHRSGAGQAVHAGTTAPFNPCPGSHMTVAPRSEAH